VIGAALLAALAIHPQDLPPATEVPETIGPVAPVPEVAPSIPRIDRAFTFDEIALSFRELAASRPRFTRLASLGKSRGEREILVLEVADQQTGDPGEKPGILFAGYGPATGTFGAETILGIARALLAGDDASLAAELADTSIYLAPALDPDLRVEGSATPEIRFERNFPYGWQPRTVRAGSGAYPLATPETLALVRFLEERTNLSLVVGFVAGGEPSGAPWKEAELPEPDRAVLASLARARGDDVALDLVPWTELGSQGGGPLDYAFQGLGIYACAFRYPAAGPEALEAYVARAVEGARGLVALLPRLALRTEGLEQLAPGLWQLDVAVRNQGGLPTLSELGGRRRAGASFRVSMEGAKLVATAHRSAAEEPFLADRLNADASSLAIGGDVLQPGETRYLRLIVEGVAGSSLLVRGSSVRSGRAALAVSLRP
jgi:hypothetical protein